MYTPTCFYDSSLVPRLHLTYVHMSACLPILHINLCEHPHWLLLSVYTNWNLDSLSTTRTGRRSEILQLISTLKRAHPPSDLIWSRFTNLGSWCHSKDELSVDKHCSMKLSSLIINHHSSIGWVYIALRFTSYAVSLLMHPSARKENNFVASPFQVRSAGCEKWMQFHWPIKIWVWTMNICVESLLWRSLQMYSN